jgi:uncharacterized protein YcaQ
VPAAKRRWGYYVLPVLLGGRLVGRIEPRIDRKGARLDVVGAWWEDGFDPLAAEGFVDPSLSRSARIGCQVYQPVWGMDPAAPCLRK